MSIHLTSDGALYTVFALLVIVAFALARAVARQQRALREINRRRGRQ